MQLFTTIGPLQEALQMVSKTQSVGFVPTMGALHEGHLSLVRNAKLVTDKVVVSIFVNPTQFDKKEDLINYPSTLQADMELLLQEKCDFLFVPSVDEMYQNSVQSEGFDFDGLDRLMEGEHREGHFNGVGTIVKRLFEITQPDSAFFGEKDFQQLQIIRKLVEKEKMDIDIIGCPIFREKDGLAMSSRNMRLTKSYRKEAPFIYRILCEAKEIFTVKGSQNTTKWVEAAFKEHPILKLEYFTIADEESLLPLEKSDNETNVRPDENIKSRAFIAVFAGKIRLIDTIAMY